MSVRVVITGMGMVSSLGSTFAECWPRLLAGESGISTIGLWDPSTYQAKVAATADYETNPLTDPGGYRKGYRMYVDSVAEALSAAGLWTGGDGADQGCGEIGLASGTSVNNLDTRQFRPILDRLNGHGAKLDVTDYLQQVDEGRTPHGMFPRMQGEMINVLAMRRFGMAGPSLVVDTACSASTHAIGEAFRMVRRGAADVMVAGGAAALVRPIHMIAFERIRALTPNSDPASASRPYDRDRNGFVMGEAAGAVILESLEHAQRRGAPILAELAGYGSASTAYTMTDPSPGGEAEARAMGLAIQDADCAPEEIGYIAAHGTSTPKGDVAETQAIRRVFGQQSGRLLVSSIKGQIGHTISAAGVCNLAVAVQAIQSGWVSPTATLRNPDPDCDLDYVAGEARQADLAAALSNSFAFGGQNAALVVRRWTR